MGKPKTSWCRAHLIKDIATNTLTCIYCTDHSWKDKPGAMSPIGQHLMKEHQKYDPKAAAKGALVQTKIQKRPVATQEDFNEALADWLLHEDVPFNSVDSVKFRKLLDVYKSVAEPVVSCRQTVTNRVLNECKEKVSEVSFDNSKSFC